MKPSIAVNRDGSLKNFTAKSRRPIHGVAQKCGYFFEEIRVVIAMLSRDFSEKELDVAGLSRERQSRKRKELVKRFQAHLHHPSVTKTYITPGTKIIMKFFYRPYMI